MSNVSDNTDLTKDNLVKHYAKHGIQVRVMDWPNGGLRIDSTVVTDVAVSDEILTMVYETWGQTFH